MDEQKPALNPDRLAAMAHYVIARCPPEELGATKLNKVLWFTDVFHYRRHGKTVSGVKSYVKRQFGPVPPGIMQAIDALKRDGKINERSVATPAGTRREFVWLQEPDVSAFTPEEIDMLNEVMSLVCKNHSAASISELTHGSLWSETLLGGEIPIGAASVVAGEVTPEVMVWAISELEGAG
jgi:hypothetical protein